jgi:hypothetical protein
VTHDLLFLIQGSCFIIYDTTKTREIRRKVVNQLMLVLSIFDMIGSCAYAFTTLPLPAEDYVYGSHGNDATCKVQGFFIQVGTISAYVNVSLAVYYLLVVKMGTSERELKKKLIWLVSCPIVVGMTFAFAGELHDVATELFWD